MAVSTNNNWLLPVAQQLGDTLENNRFIEHSTIHTVPDSCIGRSPQLLKFEFTHSRCCGCNSWALYTNL